MSDFYTNVDIIGKKVYLRTINESGDYHQSKSVYKPSLWIPTTTKSAFADVYGKPLALKEFSDMPTARVFKKKNCEIFKIHGTMKFVNSYIQEHFPSDTRENIDFSKIRVANVDIEVYTVDETTGKSEFPDPDFVKYPINAITHYDNITDKFYTFHLLRPDNIKWTPSLAVERGELTKEIADNVVYSSYSSEADLLKAYINFFSKAQPHIFTGWNTDSFDIPYIVNRMNKVLGETWTKRLSVWGIIKEKTMRGNFGNTIDGYNILGLQSLDYIKLYQKHTFENQESYKLDHIGHVELGERKISYDESEGLHGLYVNDPQKFISYNIKDVDLVKRLDEKLNIISLVQFISYFSGINYEDTFSPIRTWEAIIYNHLVPLGIIPPVESGVHESERFAGGYVKDSLAGIYNQLATFDLTSLYPSIMRQVNISPEKIEVDPMRIDISNDILAGTVVAEQPGYGLAGNGVYFKNDGQGFLPLLIERMFNDRKKAKGQSKAAASKMIGMDKNTDEYIKLKSIKDIKHTEQMVLKVLLNSCYGALSSPWFCFYDLNLAEAITLTGQTVIKWSEKLVNDYLQKILKKKKDRVVAIDTDSIMINMSEVISTFIPNEKDNAKIVDFMDGVCLKIYNDCLVPGFEDLKTKLNHFDNVMNMDREKISASGGFFVKKKRYAILVDDNEGERYLEPKLAITGLEIVKKDTPEIIRDELKRLVKQIIVTKDNDVLIDEVESFRKRYLDDKEFHYDEMAKVKSVNYIEKYLGSDGFPVKGAPMNSKAAILHNRLIDESGSNTKHIEEGDKIKIISLKVPNILIGNPNAIGYIGKLPDEFGLLDYIDYQSSYDLTFMSPLTGICDAIKWDTEETAGF